MRKTKSIIVWFIAFIGFYLLLSLLGCMFFNPDGSHISYSQVIGDEKWCFIYAVFVGWWLAGVIADEYYKQSKFKEK